VKFIFQGKEYSVERAKIEESAFFAKENLKEFPEVILNSRICIL
jgi:hypothetical protein